MDVGRMCVYSIWSSSSLMLARCMESLPLAARASWWVCCVHVSRDCMRDVSTYVAIATRPYNFWGKGSE